MYQRQYRRHYTHRMSSALLFCCFGDVSFLVKYRLLSANEEQGNYILTAFFGGECADRRPRQQREASHLHAHSSVREGLGRV